MSPFRKLYRLRSCHLIFIKSRPQSQGSNPRSSFVKCKDSTKSSKTTSQTPSKWEKGKKLRHSHPLPCHRWEVHQGSIGMLGRPLGQRTGYLVPFYHLLPVSGAIRVTFLLLEVHQALQAEVDKMLEEDPLEFVKSSLSRLFQEDGGLLLISWLLITAWLLLSGWRWWRWSSGRFGKGFDFLDRPKGRVLQHSFTRTLDHASRLSCQCIPVKATMFVTFYSFSGLYQSVFSGIRVDSHLRDFPSSQYLDDWLIAAVSPCLLEHLELLPYLCKDLGMVINQ